MSVTVRCRAGLSRRGGTSTGFVVAAVVAGVVATTFPVLVARPAAAVTQGDIEQAQSQVDALDQAAEIASEKFNAGEIRLTAARAAAATARHQAGVANAAVVAQTRAARTLVSATYRGAAQSTFISFVSAGSPQAFLDRASELQQVSSQRAATLAVVRATRQRSDDAATRARTAEAVADTDSRQLGQDKDAVESELSAKTEYVNRLSAQLRAQLAREEQAREAAQRAADLRAQQAAQLARQQAAERVAAQQEQAVQAASGTGVSTAPVSQVVVPASSSGRDQLALQYAESQIGKPYLWAAAGPDAYDCSGLVMWAFARVGIALPHLAAAQYGYGTHVPFDQLQPGDLVFFDDGEYLGHVGIYYGNGEMVDAPHSGTTVGIHPLYGGYIGATRI